MVQLRNIKLVLTNCKKIVKFDHCSPYRKQVPHSLSTNQLPVYGHVICKRWVKKFSVPVFSTWKLLYKSRFWPFDLDVTNSILANYTQPQCCYPSMQNLNSIHAMVQEIWLRQAFCWDMTFILTFDLEVTNPIQANNMLPCFYTSIPSLKAIYATVQEIWPGHVFL